MGNIDENQILSNPILANKTEYISVGETSLHKYDIIKNKWSEWIKYPHRTHASENQGAPICIDHKSNKIYLLCKSKLLIIDYKTHYIEV